MDKITLELDLTNVTQPPTSLGQITKIQLSWSFDGKVGRNAHVPFILVDDVPVEANIPEGSTPSVAPDVKTPKRKRRFVGTRRGKNGLAT